MKAFLCDAKELEWQKRTQQRSEDGLSKESM